jgi:HD superfamily phosphohydrolase YqeK
MALAWGLEPDAVEQAAPILLHGRLAASMLERDYALADPEVLAAAAHHTTARAGMSSLEKLVFLADKTEAQKLERRHDWRKVADVASSDLDAALLLFLDIHLEDAIARRWLIHPRTLEARNELLATARSLETER